MRGPTSRVTISSASPFVSRRLFFQPPNSTFSTVTFPFSSAAAGARPMTSAMNPTNNESGDRTLVVLSEVWDSNPFRGRPQSDADCARPRSPPLDGLLLRDFFLRAAVLRQFLAADDGQVQ